MENSGSVSNVFHDFCKDRQKRKLVETSRNPDVKTAQLFFIPEQTLITACKRLL